MLIHLPMAKGIYLQLYWPGPTGLVRFSTVGSFFHLQLRVTDSLHESQALPHALGAKSIIADRFICDMGIKSGLLIHLVSVPILISHF